MLRFFLPWTNCKVEKIEKFEIEINDEMILLLVVKTNDRHNATKWERGREAV